MKPFMMHSATYLYKRTFRNCCVVLTALMLHSTVFAQQSEPAPRMADGHPDLSGVWWTGGDLGSPGYNTSR
jgi:hypothetical protein